MYNPLHPIFATLNTGYLLNNVKESIGEETLSNECPHILNENKTIKAKFRR